jgi:2-C-methyl-D-erythritol 2,4-cyclodiphosphate synthase
VRVGQGYDVHRLVAGRKLVLGGVEIAHEWGLEGHSDADVALHATIDALLGAAGLGDIGGMFPSSDARWSGASSMTLLRSACARVTAAGFRAINVDVTVVAEAPRLAPHTEAMRRNIASALGIGAGSVNVKATTTDGLGMTGRGEGIAAFAVVLLE